MKNQGFQEFETRQRIQKTFFFMRSKTGSVKKKLFQKTRFLDINSASAKFFSIHSWIHNGLCHWPAQFRWHLVSGAFCRTGSLFLPSICFTLLQSLHVIPYYLLATHLGSTVQHNLNLSCDFRTPTTGLWPTTGCYYRATCADTLFKFLFISLSVCYFVKHTVSSDNFINCHVIKYSLQFIKINDNGAAIHKLYSIGRFFLRTIPSPWNHSRRNCFAAPSGVLVHSTVMRSLFRSSVAGLNVSHDTAIKTFSLGSSTPQGGSTPRRLMFVVLMAHPIRRPPALVIYNVISGCHTWERYNKYNKPQYAEVRFTKLPYYKHSP